MRSGGFEELRIGFHGRQTGLGPLAVGEFDEGLLGG
jgi:hypothetical protein